MTNRILVTAGGRPILFGENVKGCVMSSILYGSFGTTGMPFFDPVKYQKKKIQLEEMIKSLKDIKGEKYENAMKLLLEAELYMI